MKRICLLTALLFIYATAMTQINKDHKTLFDEGWRFYPGGVERGEQPKFDDSKWRMVDLPHDWSIEDIPGRSSPFDPDAVSQVSGGFTRGGTGWYRKTFTIPAEQRNKRIIIFFDGVYMNADIWLNGNHLGNHPYGYTSFWYDLTDKILPDGQNVLAVRVQNEGLNSRWYSGSGINRHVWLQFADAVHFAPWGVHVNTPVVTRESAKVHTDVLVENKTGHDENVSLTARIIDPSGKEVAHTVAKQSVNASQNFQIDMDVPQPKLWSIDSPVLYTLVTELANGAQTQTHFGIRTITANAEHGLLVNGKPVKLKGGCYHNDNGPLGSRAYDRAEERRVELMKASGFNAIRCSHNPPSPAFLDACDRLGMLVIDEAFDMWKEGKNSFDYHLYFNDWWQKDIESMVNRDRNHPSVIMWSIGNEIPNRDQPEVVTVAKQLANYVRKLDPSRLITSAVNDVRPDKDPYFAELDISGYNYAVNKYVEDHQRLPNRVMMATESYPLEAFDYWMGVLDHPYVIGDFVWTGFDYIGEASIGWRGYYQEKNFYPWNLAYCGDIDICGWKRPQSYYRDVLWKPNQLSLFVTPPTPSFEPNPNREAWSKWHWDDVCDDWTWNGNEGKTMSVTAYSSCEETELFLNDRSLGKKKTNRDTRFKATWEVPYTAGTLRAVGYTKGKKVNTALLQTAGKPTHLKLTADRKDLIADGQDLSYITVTLEDAKGVVNPKAENLIHFTVEGPATIVGVGNANPVSVESYQQPQRKAWKGKCLVIIKTEKKGGVITVKASGEGVGMASVTLTASSQ